MTLDDATSAIASAILVEEEGTASSFLGLAETIERHGLFCSLYTDRGSHYFVTPEAGGAVAKGVLTQVGRALAQLGIEHIAAYSPQARGRSERAFRTLQDRLPKELALAGIDDVAAANRYIAEVYLPAHNARFAAKPAEAGSAYVPVSREQWQDILCIQEERTVGLDNTVAWQGKRLQIPPHPARAHSCAPRSRCTLGPTARSPSSTAHAAWCAGTRRASPSRSRSRSPCKPLPGPPRGVDGVDKPMA